MYDHTSKVVLILKCFSCRVSLCTGFVKRHDSSEHPFNYSKFRRSDLFVEKNVRVGLELHRSGLFLQCINTLYGTFNRP